MQNKYKVDVLALAAHPDDVELACGASVIKMVEDGYKVAVVDFTRGEMGTRGTPDIRIQESMDAAKIMGVHFRENLGLPDCGIQPDDETIRLTVTAIRKFKPEIVLMNPAFDRHPDHQAVHQVVRKAMFISGLRKYETYFENELQSVHRIRKMFSFQQSYDYQSDSQVFYINVTQTFKKKMEAIKAYVSQVYVPGKSQEDEPVTRLSRPEFLEELEARAITYGTKIGCRYAEAFCAVEPLGLDGLHKFL